MTIQTETFNGRKLCKLSGALSIWDAVATWEQLNELLYGKSKQPVEIDFSKVESCDCAGVQIICQIRSVAEKKKDKIRITGISDALSEILTQAGLDIQSFAGHSKEA